MKINNSNNYSFQNRIYQNQRRSHLQPNFIPESPSKADFDKPTEVSTRPPHIPKETPVAEFDKPNEYSIKKPYIPESPSKADFDKPAEVSIQQYKVAQYRLNLFNYSSQLKMDKTNYFGIF